MRQPKSYRIVSTLVAFVGTAQAVADEPILGWSIEKTTAPLTGTVSVSAVLKSTQPLTNMIGQPQHAALVLRCRDGSLAAYISWVEVLPQALTSLRGQSQAMLLWRLDDQPITSNFWARDNAGIAIGHFTSKPAVKWITKLVSAKRLIVRISATSTQDAVFELGDIRAVASRVGAPCGASWGFPK